MSDKNQGTLKYGRCTENLIEISMAYASLVPDYPKLTDSESIEWKNKFVEWANEFERLYPNPEHWIAEDYLECIEAFAKQRIYEFARMDQYPFYFTFGSWEKYPYQNTYLVVYGLDERDAVKKFRRRFPDVNKDTVNCADWYSQERWSGSLCEQTWKDQKPAEIIR